MVQQGNEFLTNCINSLRASLFQTQHVTVVFIVAIRSNRAYYGNHSAEVSRSHDNPNIGDRCSDEWALFVRFFFFFFSLLNIHIAQLQAIRAQRVNYMQYHHSRLPRSEGRGFSEWWMCPTLVYQVVSKRDAATLLPITQQHVAPGTIIHSDQRQAYNQVATLPNVASHRTINHSVEFVDPVTTENVESNWNGAKLKLKQMGVCHELELSGYLDNFMWWERHGKATREAFEIYQHSTHYPNHKVYMHTLLPYAPMHHPLSQHPFTIQYICQQVSTLYYTHPFNVQCQ